MEKALFGQLSMPTLFIDKKKKLKGIAIIE